MLAKLDDAVLKAERGIIVASVAGMTLLVGADVVQRTFSRPVGKTEQFVAWIGEKLAGPLSTDSRAALEGPVGTGVFLLVALAFLSFAVHASGTIRAARTNSASPALLRSVAVGAGVLVASAVVVKLLLLVFPSSVPGAQKLALGLMLWAGMLGASLATRERRHIVIDTLKKRVAKEQERVFALASGALTGLFCGFIALLGWMQLFSEISAWAGGENVGMYESVPLPMWIATLAVPASFSIMAVRFFAYGVRDFLHGVQTGGDGGHGVDLDQLAKETIDISAAPPTATPAREGA